MILVFSIIAFCLFTAMVGFEIGFHLWSATNKTLREDLDNCLKREFHLMDKIQDSYKIIRDWEVRYNNLRDDKRL